MWLSASGQSSAIRMAVSTASAPHTCHWRSAFGKIRTTTAAARITGRTNHGPIGRRSNAIAVSRSAVSK